ncbi:hypothetical protein [Gimesia algae]|uniref:Uncharacterized protein n=1 Tax=Gimesia algae TaxID=2527971 RepID=A0A517V7Y6_9PLAN|nr:hypothetical protein [Gimesia algae]QDT89099.1 hypothetical protein Pan161_07240 [Gimesia algae]
MRRTRNLMLSLLVWTGMGLLLSSTTAQAKAKVAGKKSLGGSGEMIQLNLPAEQRELSGIRIHGSRYGTAKPPQEQFLIYVLNQDLTEVVATEMAPYALFERGAEQWVEIKFPRPITVPADAWVIVDFRAGRTKGVYVSYDDSTEGSRSRIGLPGIEPKPTGFSGNWMIEPLVSR